MKDIPKYILKLIPRVGKNRGIEAAYPFCD